MYNLDDLDMPALDDGGVPFSFRGVVYKLRAASIQDSFGDQVQTRFESEESVKEYLRSRFFKTNREMERFWKAVNSEHTTSVGLTIPPLSLPRLIRMISEMTRISAGTAGPAAGETDPKEGDS